MDRTNSNLHWFESSWSSNDVFHSPAFLGTSQASLCSWKSPTLSFPDIVYNIILDPGSASRVIQHFLHPNLFILPRFYETALLNVKTADCAALSPFLCRDTVFQCRSLWLKCCRDSEAIMSPPNTKELCSPSLTSSLIKAYVLGPFYSGRCERGAGGVGSSVALWLCSVVTRKGALLCPQWASTSRALPLFKNVFVLLFFLGTM